MTASIVRSIAAVALVAVASACSPPWANDDSAPVEITVAADGTSELTLFVSNQSFTDKSVDVTVMLNGDIIIERGFNVGDQHNYVEHRIRLDKGTHTLSATTVIDGESVELSEGFTIESDHQRYAALNYSHYVPTAPNDPSSSPPGFSFRIQNEPIGFA